MAIDFKSLKKLQSMPASDAAVSRGDDERLLVLVKLHKGASKPDFISPRASIAPQMFSAEIDARDLAKIEADPAVESVAISQRLPLIK